MIELPEAILRKILAAGYVDLSNGWLMVDLSGNPAELTTQEEAYIDRLLTEGQA